MENLELKNSLKMKDLEIKERSLTLPRNSLNDSSQIETLKQALESKDRLLREGERRVKELEEKCCYLEEEKSRNAELVESLKNSASTSKSSKVTEDFYKKKIESLTEEVFTLKRQLEESNSNAEMMKLELESEVSRLKIENSVALKQKNEKSGPLTLRNRNEKTEDLAGNYAEIQNLRDQLRALDTEKKAIDHENRRLLEKMNEKERENKEIKERTSSLELEVQKTKMKLAEILNVAFETGGAELVELIENAVVDQRLSLSKE